MSEDVRYFGVYMCCVHLLSLDKDGRLADGDFHVGMFRQQLYLIFRSLSQFHNGFFVIFTVKNIIWALGLAQILYGLLHTINNSECLTINNQCDGLFVCRSPFDTSSTRTTYCCLGGAPASPRFRPGILPESMS
ncbi:hypothetical protein NP493_961g01000 [Ridgeia piscesae]|uniref:Uncharacterized protein n=1 Tax=Ridgeia piscesae TaxID=27915 RepID=A0AAD9NJM8_RIDPI|nr:hypothetical protein NP493_961g01000 [Ridgeia piscesae]